MKEVNIDHALNFVDMVILFIAKDNFRSAKAAEKIGAKLIVEPKKFNIITRDPNNMAYVIQKKDWIDH